MRAPPVSVVIPFYNRERELPRAIESVLAQTYDGWEIVLVDDGSTDGSLAAAMAYVERMPDRVRLFRQENQGESGARNRAIREARGQLIGILDSDDEWDHRFLERTVPAFAACPAVDWMYVNARRVADDGGRVLVPSVFDDDRSSDFRDLSTRRYGDLSVIDDPRLLTTAILSTIKAGANSIVRRHVFDSVTYPLGLKVGADKVLVIAAIAGGFRFGFVDEVLLTVHHHGANASMTDSRDPRRFLRQHHELIRSFEYLRRNVRLGPEARSAVRTKLSQLYFEYAVRLVESRTAYFHPISYLSKSVMLDPVGTPLYGAVRNRASRAVGIGSRLALLPALPL